jgi:hypothetical protein
VVGLRREKPAQPSARGAPDRRSQKRQRQN